MQFVQSAVVLLFLIAPAVTTHADCGVYTVPAEGGMPKRLTKPTGGSFGSPCWSPDGKTVAFDYWGGGLTTSDSQLGVVPAEGGEISALGVGAMPSFSPDGSQIVCHTYRPNQIVVLNIDGDGREAVLPQWGSPRWSPDGQSIVTAMSGGGVGRYQLATGKQDVLVARRYRVMQGLSLSPDGKRICFSDRSTMLQIATEQEGGWYDVKHRATCQNPGHSSWFPDSQRVVFSAQGADAPSWEGKKLSRLYVCNADDAADPTPIPGIPDTWNCCDPSLSKDGG